MQAASFLHQQNDRRDLFEKALIVILFNLGGNFSVELYRLSNFLITFSRVAVSESVLNSLRPVSISSCNIPTAKMSER